MKILKLIALGCLIFVAEIASGAPSNRLFNGSWDWSASPESRTFSINIKQRDGEISGQYCAVAQNGNRVDCDDEDNPNIHGVADQNDMSVMVGFSSFFGAENGVARLTINNGRLTWEIIKSPMGGDFYAPKKAVLNRRK